MDALAALTAFIPENGLQLARYYGYYSNKARGKRRRQNAATAIPGGFFVSKIVSATLLFMLMSASTYAATLTFAWDPKPADQNWTMVRLYEKSGTTYTLLIEVAGTATQATVTNITPGAHSFVARSFDGTWESSDSNVVVTGPVPNPPGNFKILTVVLASAGALAAVLLAFFRRK